MKKAFNTFKLQQNPDIHQHNIYNIQSKFIRHAKKQENVTHNQEI